MRISLTLAITALLTAAVLARDTPPRTDVVGPPAVYDAPDTPAWVLIINAHTGDWVAGSPEQLPRLNPPGEQVAWLVIAVDADGRSHIDEITGPDNGTLCRIFLAHPCCQDGNWDACCQHWMNWCLGIPWNGGNPCHELDQNVPWLMQCSSCENGWNPHDPDCVNSYCACSRELVE
jgi:hypothetical protein